jgi:hypothetical protein
MYVVSSIIDIEYSRRGGDNSGGWHIVTLGILRWITVYCFAGQIDRYHYNCDGNSGDPWISNSDNTETGR